MTRLKTTLNYFTLVELVVVIAIITVLISLLMPALKKATEQGENLLCLNNLKTLFIADDYYAEDNNDHYVVIKPEEGSYNYWFLNKTYMSYLDVKELRNNFEYACPSYQSPSYFGFSYALNWTNDKFYWGSFSGQTILRNRVSNTSSKIKMIESTDWHAYFSQADPQKWFNYGETRSNTVAYRHFEGCNMSFLDGHVEHRKSEDVYFDGDVEKIKELWEIEGDNFTD